MTELLGALHAARVVGVLRAATPEQAVHAARAAVRGGLRALELTFTTPGVAGALAELRGELAGRVLLGAGTVLNAAQAAEALEAGAAFLVSPHLGEDVLEVARAAGVPYLPGVLTPTEAVRALTLRAPAVKLFPARLGGPAYLRDLRGPLPELQVMATGGIELHEVGDYLAAGALAVGLGGQLFPAAALRAGDWKVVEVAVREALRNVRQAVPQGQEAV